MRKFHIPLALLCLASATLCASSAQGTIKPCEGAPSYNQAAFSALDEAECRLDEKQPCERIRPATAEAIFVGEVVSYSEDPQSITIDGECLQGHFQTIRLKVQETFAGDISGVVTVHAGGINGFYFWKQGTFLVVAKHRPDGDLTVSGCGGSKPMRDAAEDLTFLRSWKARPPEGTLYVQTWSDPDNPRIMAASRSLDDQLIHITGP